jgi:hypothetical protein
MSPIPSYAMIENGDVQETIGMCLQLAPQCGPCTIRTLHLCRWKSGETLDGILLRRVVASTLIYTSPTCHVPLVAPEALT